MLKAVTQERMAALDAVDQMLGETMAQLRDERVAVVDAMRTERVLVGQELSAYADALLAKSEPALTKGLDEITERGVFLTDHTFKRLAQLGILTLIFMTAMLLIVMRLRPNRGVLHVATTNVVGVPKALEDVLSNPRFTPSVDPMAMVRTTPSPSCCCTSRVRSASLTFRAS